MAPSQLQIATSALNRLVKEEASYHKEMASQQKRITELEQQENNQDENRDFMIKQEKKALKETEAVFPSLRERIANAREKLQALLDTSTSESEVEAAKKALAEAIEHQKNDPNSAAHPSGPPQ